MVDGPGSFRTIPNLVAQYPSHLPKYCMLLLGVPQINDFDIQLDTHRKTRGLPLASYDTSIDFSADMRLQCHLSEKDQLAWAEHHIDTSVDSIHYTYLNVEYYDGLTPTNCISFTWLVKHTNRSMTLPKVASRLLPTIPSSR